MSSENIALSIFMVLFILPCNALDFYGRSLKFMSLDEKLEGLCEYVKSIDEVLNKTQFTTDTYEIAWIYGYLSALLSVENDKLRSIIEAYNNGQLQSNHTKRIFDCFQSFISKLTLSTYIYEHKLINLKFKKQYLPATEDIRSIMESGILLSFYMQDDKKPNILRKRFLSMYNKREEISDPVNNLFKILNPNTINSTENMNFISNIPIWSECHSNFSKLSETLTFLNSLQRYLISGMFAEELYILLKYKNSTELKNSTKSLIQLEQHRREYRSINQALTKTYTHCYLSLKNNQDHEIWKNKMFPKLSTAVYWNSNTYIIVLIGIFLINYIN